MITEVDPSLVFKVVFVLLKAPIGNAGPIAGVKPVLVVDLKKRKKHIYVKYIVLDLKVDQATKASHYSLPNFIRIDEIVQHHFKPVALAKEADFATIVEEALTANDPTLRKAAAKYLKTH